MDLVAGDAGTVQPFDARHAVATAPVAPCLHSELINVTQVRRKIDWHRATAMQRIGMIVSVAFVMSSWGALSVPVQFLEMGGYVLSRHAAFIEDQHLLIEAFLRRGASKSLTCGSNARCGHENR